VRARTSSLAAIALTTVIGPSFPYGGNAAPGRGLQINDALASLMT